MAARASTPESDGRSKGENRNGAQGRDRTTDTAIFNRMLYQLSYLGAENPPDDGRVKRGGYRG